MTSIEQFQSDTERLRRDALQAFEQAATLADLEAARIQFVGDRSGQLKAIQQALGALPKEDKPVAGRAFNEVKAQVTAAQETRARELTRHRATGSDALDLTMPARRAWQGAKHPV